MRTVLSALMMFSLALVPGLSTAGDTPRTAYTAGNVEATRFADSETKSVDIPAGVEVEVVAETASVVRVRYRSAFGWMASSLLTDQAPVAADTVDLSLDGPPGFR
jgi:NaMN:DMB phosphoribosyltransferase